MPRKGTVLSPEAAARQRAAQKAWLAENTTKVTFSWRKEKVERYKALAQARGSSLSGLIQALLDRECERAPAHIFLQPRELTDEEIKKLNAQIEAVFWRVATP